MYSNDCFSLISTLLKLKNIIYLILRDDDTGDIYNSAHGLSLLKVI